MAKFGDLNGVLDAHTQWHWSLVRWWVDERTRREMMGLQEHVHLHHLRNKHRALIDMLMPRMSSLLFKAVHPQKNQSCTNDLLSNAGNSAITIHVDNQMADGRLRYDSFIIRFMSRANEHVLSIVSLARCGNL